MMEVSGCILPTDFLIYYLHFVRRQFPITWYINQKKQIMQKQIYCSHLIAALFIGRKKKFTWHHTYQHGYET